MKKVLSVFMAILMIFTSISVVAFAAVEPEETTTMARYPEPEPSTGIVDDDGLVVPKNPTQLTFAFFFKIIEKVISTFTGLFDKLDEILTGNVSDAGKWLEEAVSNIFGSLEG